MQSFLENGKSRGNSRAIQGIFANLKLQKYIKESIELYVLQEEITS